MNFNLYGFGPAHARKWIVVDLGVTFGDVSMNWYMDQTDKPLVGTLGHLMDSVGLSVPNLDPWIAKLKAEGVHFLKEEYKYGNTRAIMIEGPSHEAIALVEVK